jgi:hypothetical protein
MKYVVHDGSTGKLNLRDSLLQCGNISVESEAFDIKYNVPGLFVDEEQVNDQLSMVRTIQCPNCLIEFEVDLEEYIWDFSSYEKKWHGTRCCS